jgi:hypothetical protein
MKLARPFIALVGFLGAIFFTPWISALCIVVLAVRFRSWEAILLGLFVDLLWLPPDSVLHGLPLFTLGAVLIVWAFEPLRSEFLAT